MLNADTYFPIKPASYCERHRVCRRAREAERSRRVKMKPFTVWQGRCEALCPCVWLGARATESCAKLQTENVTLPLGSSGAGADAVKQSFMSYVNRWEPSNFVIFH